MIEWIEWIGWIAAGLFVVAYFLVSQDKISGHGKIFNFMNLSGALLYGFYGWKIGAHPIVILELFWGGIAIVAIYRVFHTEFKKNFNSPNSIE